MYRLRRAPATANERARRQPDSHQKEPNRPETNGLARIIPRIAVPQSFILTYLEDEEPDKVFPPGAPMPAGGWIARPPQQARAPPGAST